MHSEIRIGCAGWYVPNTSSHAFPLEGSHLERYSSMFKAVEINSSFYRPHNKATYARWADSVPANFRFAVKVPKSITHERRLQDCKSLFAEFVFQAGGLGNRLGVMLIQLPPSLPYEAALANTFFKGIRNVYGGLIALEGRHSSWFTEAANVALVSHRVARVLADPVKFDEGRWPGGDVNLIYLRLHGSPRMYYSGYARGVLDDLALRLELAAKSSANVWCIFDNTAEGAATNDALYTASALHSLEGA